MVNKNSYGTSNDPVWRGLGGGRYSTYNALLSSLRARAFALFLRFAMALLGLRVSNVDPFFCLLAARRVMGMQSGMK